MTAEALIEILRDRGIVVRAVGDRLKVRPASAVSADEVEALKRHKPEILRLLAIEPQFILPDLDSRALAEHFGLEVPPYATTETVNAIINTAVLSGRIDPKGVTDLHELVVAAVRGLEWEISAGRIERRLRLVAGRPLADWLPLQDVARLLSQGGGR